MRFRFVIPAALVAAGAYIASREPVPGPEGATEAEPDMTAANWAEAPAPVVDGLEEIAVAATVSPLAWPPARTAEPEPVAEVVAPEPEPVAEVVAPEPEPVAEVVAPEPVVEVPVAEVAEVEEQGEVVAPEGPGSAAPPAPLWDFDDDWAAFQALVSAAPASAPIAAEAVEEPQPALNEWVAELAATLAPAAPSVEEPEPELVLSEWDATPAVAAVPVAEVPAEPRVDDAPGEPEVDDAAVAVVSDMEEWLRTFDVLVDGDEPAPAPAAPAAQSAPESAVWPDWPHAGPAASEEAVEAPVAVEVDEAAEAVESHPEPEAVTAPEPVAEVAPEPVVEVDPEPGPVVRSGRFSIGGWASAAGEVAIAGVSFDPPLEAGPWAVELQPEGTRNVDAGSLVVLDAPGFAPDADGFAVSVASAGEGPFLANGAFAVRAASDEADADR